MTAENGGFLFCLSKMAKNIDILLNAIYNVIVIFEGSEGD